MEEELKTSYPDSNIKLLEGGGGIFDVTCNGKLIYSRKSTARPRFPDKGEITRLIEQTTG